MTVCFFMATRFEFDCVVGGYCTGDSTHGKCLNCGFALLIATLT